MVPVLGVQLELCCATLAGVHVQMNMYVTLCTPVPEKSELIRRETRQYREGEQARSAHHNEVFFHKW